MQKFGLIGKTLKHSFSKKIHPYFADYTYDLIEVQPENLSSFIKENDYDGFNVTIPYKKDVIEFLDVVDERAKKIGAVNTVVRRNGKLYGYNTDFDGMVYALNSAGINLKDKVVLILGSGGTSNTAKAVAESLGASSIKKLSRTGEINYQNYSTLAGDAQVIINTTPVGMYPENYSCLIDLKNFANLSGVLDVVYNPALTMLLKQAKDLGVPYANGQPMLVTQAKVASELFLDKKHSDKLIEEVIGKLKMENQNLVLVGMPGSGKSTIGRAVAELLNKEFIDTDQVIEQKENKSIPQIFAEFGEDYFRKIEREVLSEVGKLSGKVISTGGGIVKNADNYFYLKQNGVIIWIDRDIELLSCENRPLSKDLDAVKKLYNERKDKYAFFADEKISNDGSLDSAVKETIKVYENFSYKRT